MNVLYISDILLIENVNLYQSTKGKKLIPWIKIINDIKEFNGCSPNALVKRFKTIRKIDV